MNYADFIKSKIACVRDVGFTPDDSDLHESLFDFQKYITKWAIEKGKCAIFAECGLGKTLMQLVWASAVCRQTSGKVLIVAPLAVSEQTIQEALKFGYAVSRTSDKIQITNYERLHQFDLTKFDGVVLDESSILKNYTGKIRNSIIDGFQNTPFKLACTATPAPNDYMELGNHSEFLNVKSRVEMLAEYFVHDGGETQVWRLKRHAINSFWTWVKQWAVICSRPSDLGFSDENLILPALETKQVIVESNYESQGFLFPMLASSMTERRAARKHSLSSRVDAVRDIVSKEPDKAWIIWCNLNNEAEALQDVFPSATEVRGSEQLDLKAKKLNSFTTGSTKILITKPSIAGFGMNWQHCNRIVFCGLSDSFEEYYQAVRRCWRFGQKEPVKVYIVTSHAEQNVVKNVMRKQQDFIHMQEAGAAYG